MKRIIYFIIIIVLGGTAGCSSYENDFIMEVLELESSDVIFDAYGGDGYIIAGVDGTVTARPNKDWIDVSVVGKRVNVTVGPHYEPTGRYGLIKVSYGGKSVDVPVSQTGDIFSTDDTAIHFPTSGGSTAIKYNSLQGITSVDNPLPWVQYEIKENEIIFSVEEVVPPANPKQGVITLNSGQFSIDINLSQEGKILYEHLLGNWTMRSLNTSNASQTHNVQLTVATEGSSYYMGPFTYSGNEYYIEVEFNDLDMSLLIRNAQNLGLYDSKVVCNIARDANAGYVTTGTSVTYSADIGSDHLNPVYTFYDNGTWGTYKMTGFYIRYYSGGPIGSGTATNLFYFGGPVLTKVDTIVP